jgi:ABC-type multidrug transport system fused ATPase/permease subunit
VYNPSILILDEATSSVDNESETLIQDATERLTKGRTSIVIAHRLSTIKNAHKIVVLEQGEIVEIGTHTELMERNGYYRKLHDKQFTEENTKG